MCGWLFCDRIHRYKRRVVDDPAQAAEEKAERAAAAMGKDGETPNDGDAKGFRKV